jgi:hypothetical protein
MVRNLEDGPEAGIERPPRSHPSAGDDRSDGTHNLAFVIIRIFINNISDHI